MPRADAPYRSDEPGFRVFRIRVQEMGLPHIHDQIEVLVVESGGLVHEQCGRTERLHAGDLIAFWAAFPHRTVRAEPGTTLLLLYLPLDWFLGEPAWAGTCARWLRREALTDRGRGHAAWARTCLALASGDAVARHRLRLEIELHLLRRLAGAGGDEPDGHGRDRQHVGRMIAMILARYAEPLRIADIAAAAGLHPGHAQAVFRRSVGLPLWEFVLGVRTAHAQRLLMDPQRTVLDAGLAAGFGSAARFHATFRRLTGLSPRQHRLSHVAPTSVGTAGGLQSAVS